jgi:hypothetical protein
MKFLAQGATFNLPQITDVHKDKGDISLVEGHSIFPHEEAEYGPFMACQGPGNDVSEFGTVATKLTCTRQMSTCSNLKAMKLQSVKKIQESFQVQRSISTMSLPLYHSLLHRFNCRQKVSGYSFNPSLSPCSYFILKILFL